MWNKNFDPLIYDEEAGVAVCIIAKVASSTWLDHFSLIKSDRGKNIENSFFRCLIVNSDNTSRPRGRDNAALQEYLPHPPKEGERIEVSKF